MSLFLQAKIEKCTDCSKYIEEVVPNFAAVKSPSESHPNTIAKEAENQARELELELARTKLALVEAECKNQVCSFKMKFFHCLLFSYWVTIYLFIYFSWVCFKCMCNIT